MLLYFSVCRLSDLSELVKYWPHPVSVDRFYTEPRNITGSAERRLSGSKHQAQYSCRERCSHGTGGRLKNGPRGNKQEVFLKIFFAHYSERFRDFSPFQQHFHPTRYKNLSLIILSSFLFLVIKEIINRTRL